MNREPEKLQLKRRKKKLRPIFAGLLAVCILLIGIAAFFWIYLGTNVKPPEVEVQNPDNPEEIISLPKETYTFLLVGRDNPNNSRNTDVLMLCSFDTKGGDVNVLQIPRDIYVVDPLAPYGGKINNIFNLAATDYREMNPDATSQAEFDYAMGYLCDKISDIFAVDVDFYLSFNTVMYRELLEIVCPITIDVPFDMDYDDPTQDLHIHLKAGVQQLNPEQAEGFSRFRQNNGMTSGLPEGDFSRVDLQKMVLAAIAEKFFSNFSLPSAHALAGTVWNNLDTDLEMNECIWFLQQALTLYTEGTMTLDSIRMYDLPCKVPTPWECTQLLGLDYTVSYGFMETSFGYTLEILNKAFNTKDTPITAEMLGYEEAVDLGGYCDHSDTEGQSLQQILDNPPDLWISNY